MLFCGPDWNACYFAALIGAHSQKKGYRKINFALQKHGKINFALQKHGKINFALQKHAK